MKIKLKEQRATILASLADQNEDMKGLVKTVDSGDEADVASDVIDRALLTALGAQDSNRLQQINNALDRIKQGKLSRCFAWRQKPPRNKRNFGSCD